MKWWLIFPVLFLVFIQTTIVSFNFLLVLVLLLALLDLMPEAVAFAFLGGLLLDLLAGTGLGISSLSYLVPVGIILAYSRRFQTNNIFFWVLLFPVATEIFDFIRLGKLQLENGVIFFLIGLVSYIALSRFGALGEGQEEGIRLKI